MEIWFTGRSNVWSWWMWLLRQCDGDYDDTAYIIGGSNMFESIKQTWFSLIIDGIVCVVKSLPLQKKLHSHESRCVPLHWYIYILEQRNNMHAIKITRTTRRVKSRVYLPQRGGTTCFSQRWHKWTHTQYWTKKHLGWGDTLLRCESTLGGGRGSKHESVKPSISAS